MKIKKTLVVLAVAMALVGVASATPQNSLDFKFSVPMSWDLYESTLNNPFGGAVISTTKTNDFLTNLGGDVTFTTLLTKNIGVTADFNFSFPVAGSRTVKTITDSSTRTSTNDIDLDNYEGFYKLGGLIGPTIAFPVNKTFFFRITPAFSLAGCGYTVKNTSAKASSVYLGPGVLFNADFKMGKRAYFTFALELSYFCWRKDTATDGNGNKTSAESDHNQVELSPSIGIGFRF